MSGTLTLRSPAKLNLFLHVTGRRADGYHLLQTVFQLLDLCDEIRFTASAAPALVLEGAVPGVAVEDNLVMKAARALAARCAPRRGAIIRLDKRIPHGGGLGGGSSDAATTLLALNRLWGCGLTSAELAGIGLALGADVPVFVHGHSASSSRPRAVSSTTSAGERVPHGATRASASSCSRSICPNAGTW